MEHDITEIGQLKGDFHELCRLLSVYLCSGRSEDRAELVQFLDSVADDDDVDDSSKCNCGASRDPGACGHHPSCPMKKLEG